ncbi:MAG: hypothetical protein M1836_001775 [Candelina mexicana]|nr:MAG: hypothetical protein M1836_001775 [Candelina mexicana]
MYHSAIIVSLLVVLSIAAPSPLLDDATSLLLDEPSSKMLDEPFRKMLDEPSSPLLDERGNVTYCAKPNATAFTNWTEVAFPKPEDCNALGSSAVQRACSELVLLQPKVPSDKGIWHWFRWWGCTVGYMIPPAATGDDISMERCKSQIFQPMIDYAINDSSSPHASYSINLSTHPKKNRVQGQVVNATSIAFMVTGQQQTCDRCS